MNISKYYHTVRYLRPVQIYGRLWYGLYHPKPDLSPPPAIRPLSGIWHDPAKKSPSLIGPERFRFFNVEHDISSALDWNNPAWEKLWLYNLHYFDDLNAIKADERVDWQRSLIMRWVAENEPGCGTGWEPYPLSLRIVNWIKWRLAGNTLSSSTHQNLAIQVRFLFKRIEYHLPGNHLLANAKALIFAGCFFEGREADKWLKKGTQILTAQLGEQILKDGGHFELSPMYHSIVLEDLLDLINISRCYSVTIDADSIVEISKRMIVWLKFMCHPDGQIALFNDAAFGIASQPIALFDYAERLGIRISDGTITGQLLVKSSIEYKSFGHIRLSHLKTSGYIRVENGPMTAILDVGAIGPDYLPGHAHADTLTFEMSFHGQRIVVNSGTSVYGEDVTRFKQRGTACHNTVIIDGKDSSEVWGGFRVARRARPFGLSVNRLPSNAVSVRCAHDGYRCRTSKAIHWREWKLDGESIAVNDFVEGHISEAVGYIHFDPSVRLEKAGSSFRIHLASGQQMLCRIDPGCGRLVDTTYHPEFGVNQSNQCLQVHLSGNRSSVVFSW